MKSHSGTEPRILPKAKETIWWSPLTGEERHGQKWRLLIPGQETKAFSKVVCSGAPHFTPSKKKQLRFRCSEDESEHSVVHYVVKTQNPTIRMEGINIHVTRSEMSSVVTRLAPGDFVKAWVPRGQEKKLLNWVCLMSPVFHGYVNPYDEDGLPCLQRVSASAVKVATMVTSMRKLSHHAHMHREHRVRKAQMMLSGAKRDGKGAQPFVQREDAAKSAQATATTKPARSPS